MMPEFVREELQKCLVSYNFFPLDLGINDNILAVA